MGVRVRIVIYGDSLTEGRPGVPYVPPLAALLPDHEIASDSRGGESAVSLSHRLAQGHGGAHADLAIVWIGVNDVFPHVSPTFPPLRRLLRMPWARGSESFREHYGRVLDQVGARADHVVAAGPVFLGEDLTSRWMRELAERDAVIAELAGQRDGVTYLDMRSRILWRGDPHVCSGYVAHSAVRVLVDVATLTTAERVDHVSERRGLFFTLDGVHLNSRGAKAVAEVFAEEIGRLASARGMTA